MKMRSLLILLVVLFAASVAQAGTVYRWIDDTGVLCVTDDVKRVPAKYRDKAETLELPALAAYGRYTKVPSSVPSRLAGLREQATKRATVAPEKSCGTVTVRSERRDVGMLNKRYFIAEDRCGVLFDAPFYPEFVVRR
jgi:hypothetical protein